MMDSPLSLRQALTAISSYSPETDISMLMPGSVHLTLLC
jgi:hypothetical protein